MIERKKTRQVSIDNVQIGGNAPISVQSMTNTDTRNAEKTLEQIYACASHGCDIIRVAVPDEKAVEALPTILDRVPIPVIGDIHFNHELAIQAIEKGVHCIRINPGNIGSNDKVKKIIDAAKQAHIPIRIGVNAGSLEKDIKKKFGITADALVESAMRYVRFFETQEFYDIKLSLKASSVPLTIKAYRKISERCNFPLHLGITEAGTVFSGSIRSSIGIGTLLAEGIGDTIRVSLAAEPVEEVKVGVEILRALDLRKGPHFIVCPTCGRTEIDIIPIAQQVEAEVRKMKIRENISIAIMGCVVNGPGEAEEADIGIAGGKGQAVLFRKGKILRKISEENIISELIKEISTLL
ncbi:MAG TPA: flavodoxin-dependent (E)-4-hydroxy-3-methylbut-2-enyl-diphosphate synthase [Candidatus Cloacimonetes bacterium]|nr:flavodoxin-dependent (E)-4-hydroxy-3-methylbut-2-enyl-diphosphate synthase [Candidatus Cloacimonadota bacterium]HEX38318.1 flavodoxin-dependent (E)-4-hydroxy-3-methylbut-2-enyl-diphosphate synthase [Candidatus Cloacimonadota bacterium]